MNDEKKILVVEDDPSTRRMLQAMLRDVGFQATAVGDGSAALTYLKQEGLPHLILLDLGLPGMDGFALGHQIKRMGDVPIIILTGDNTDESKIHGIEEFAEDYITKPFNVGEIVVRIRRVLSRITDYSYAQGRMIEIDNHLSIDFANNRVLLNGAELTLTPTETNLLHILLKNKGRIVSSETLILRVWPNEEVFEETLRVHMHRLRRKLQGDSNDHQYIYTERGAGYSFVVPDDQA